MKEPPIPAGGRWPPKLSFEERAVLLDAANGPYTGGPYTAEVERKMCAITGAPHAVAFNSCTSAIHAALVAMGVRHEHTVTVPSFTFAGTVTGAGHIGCALDIVDVDRDTLTLVGPFNPRSRLILTVDLHGAPHFYDRTQIGGVPVLNDSCQALGSKIGGRHIGWRGTHCWSFSAAKMVPAPDGGCVTTDDRLLADQLRELRDYGTSVRPGIARANADVIWKHGHNWRPSELSMALVSSRLGYLDGAVRRANEVDAALKAAARDVGWWAQTADSDDAEPAWHKTRVGPSDWNIAVAERIEKALHEHGVPTHHWGEIALHEMTAYHSADRWWGPNPTASLAGIGTFCLGTEQSPPMIWTDAEVERAVRAIRTVGEQTHDDH